MSTIEKSKSEPAQDAPKMFKVTISSGEDEADKGHVVLAHNYKQILIQRDKEVTIPATFLECLKHAVVETVVKTADGISKTVRIPRFSYSVMPA